MFPVSPSCGERPLVHDNGTYVVRSQRTCPTILFYLLAPQSCCQCSSPNFAMYAALRSFVLS